MAMTTNFGNKTLILLGGQRRETVWSRTPVRAFNR